MKSKESHLKLPKTQPAWLIIDIFRGQMTEDVLIVLKGFELVVRVPANMTYIFQPLDLTVNETLKTLYAKRFPSGTIDKSYTL